DEASVRERAPILSAYTGNNRRRCGIDHVAIRVDDNERRHDQAVRHQDGAAANAPFHSMAPTAELSNRRAGSGTERPFSDWVSRCSACRPIPALTVWPRASITDVKIEDRRSWDDRHTAAAKGDPDPSFFQVLSDTKDRFQPERTPA